MGKKLKPGESWNPSPKQLASMLYGQRLRGLGNVGELIKHLNALGFTHEARLVQGATVLLKSAAREEYETRRKELDPDFETWQERYYRQCYEE